MSKITPFLWFDNNVEEALDYYKSIFKNAKVKDIVRWGPGGPGPEGSVLTASFELEGQEFVALNGGPQFKFTEAVSFVVNCESQEEVDYYWQKLTGSGGQESMCGWLKDKFGLSWQIVPRALPGLLKGKDSASAQRVTQALMQMKKIELPVLQHAYDGN